jgi:triose/dihydroxyacetone kinase / FAD-AMP lyase (cyclizing)
MLSIVLVDAKLLDATIRLACERAIASEPDLTKWDMVMGDGDCGEAVKGVSEGIVFLEPQYDIDTKPMVQLL